MVAVDIERAVSEIGNAEGFPGLTRAWRWSPMSRFVFSLALDDEGDWAYQVNTLDSFDEGLVRAVLEFAREHRLGRGQDAQPFTVVPGFTYGSYGFDAVVSVPPAVHGYHIGRNEDLNEVVSAVFPAYQCEFSGSETLDEATYRFKRMLHPTVMSRPPVPYLRMKYDNTKTGGGSVGPDRGFTTPDVLLRELELLQGAPGSYVEFENYRGEVWRIVWDGAWIVNGASQDVPLSEEWVMTSLGCPTR
ncbi:hypothetical protein [Streptomyces griseosporeus]|uniref:hypothetical protein n=1 Tax=Streptomyces griseosporeus TaxID=1910 RepID=UPI00167E47A7|nr:hypothetical protein [Streptomyces griseosporeus]GHF77860.1 hypothetical protein GCM10018783_55070 [Streptomyces griseosporeus]